MIALFAMIAFVTNLCSPMASIIQAQGEIPGWLAQLGNFGNFVAYLVMGIPAGMLIAKFGYKKTALIGLAIGIAGILIQWCSGMLDAQSNLGLVFAVYLIGAFIARAIIGGGKPETFGDGAGVLSIITLVVAVIVSIALEILAKKLKLTWLEPFVMPIGMIVAMVAAIVFFNVLPEDIAMLEWRG